MCQGCVNPVVAFSWLGAILVNLSFVALISWGSATFWPVGLGLGILYTALLFYAAHRLRRREKPPALVVDVLLLMGVIGIGSSGMILTYNVLGCGAIRPIGPSTSDGIVWSFPATAAGGSAEVTAWAAQRRWESGSRATFVFEPTTSHVFFRGQNATSGAETLWIAPTGGVPPTSLDERLTYPQSLVAVAQHVCFTSSPFDSPSSIFCYRADGSSYTRLTLAGDDEPSSPEGLLAAYGSLYFKAAAYVMGPSNARPCSCDLYSLYMRHLCTRA